MNIHLENEKILNIFRMYCSCIKKKKKEKTLEKISLSNLLVVSNNNKVKYETVTLMEHNYRWINIFAFWKRNE